MVSRSQHCAKVPVFRTKAQTNSVRPSTDRAYVLPTCHDLEITYIVDFSVPYLAESSINYIGLTNRTRFKFLETCCNYGCVFISVVQYTDVLLKNCRGY